MLLERAPLLASQEENEWPREDHTNPFAQPERTGVVRVHQKSQDQLGAKVEPSRRTTAPDRRAQDLLPLAPPAEKAAASKDEDGCDCRACASIAMRPTEADQSARLLDSDRPGRAAARHPVYSRSRE